MSPQEVLFWVALVCCAVAELAIVRSAFAARSTPDGTPIRSPRRAVEVAWALVPALVLAAVLAWTWQEMRAERVATTSTQSAARGPMPGDAL